MKRFFLPLGLASFLCAASTLYAPPPAWWSGEETRILEEGGEENNYAPANLGQLKHVAKKAKEYLEDPKFPGGAGQEITDLVDSFEPQTGQGYTQQQIDQFIEQNYAPINLGQLKRVAKLFYDRLIANSYNTRANLVARGYPSNWAHDYPWDPDTDPAENYAPANLGQLKMVFSFDLSAPPGELPAWWIAHYFPGQSGILPSGNADGDSLTNLQEYEQASDPRDYFSQGSTTYHPEVINVSGDDQVGPANEYLAEPLVVEVRSGTTVLKNAPVVYTVTSGSGGLSTTSSGTVTSGTLTVFTGTADGRAQVYFKQAADATSAISVTSGTSAPAVFYSTLGGGLWSRWAFDDETGTVAEEASGEGADGTLVNDVTWTQGFDGDGAVRFSGSNGYVTMGDPATRSLDLGQQDFSVSFWVRYSELPAPGTLSRIVSKGFEEWGTGYFVGLDENGRLMTGIGSASDDAAHAIQFGTEQAFNDDAWHYVAVVYDRTNFKARIFVDGTPRGLAQAAGTAGVIDNDEIDYSAATTLVASATGAPFTVSSFSGTNQFFKGDLDDLSIYRATLAEEDVQENYNASGDGDSLPDWWEVWVVNLDPNDEVDSLDDITPEGNPDGDSLNNYDEWQQGLNPLNGGDAMGRLVVHSGDEQTAAPNQTAPAPLKIKALDFLDRNMVSVPVRVRVAEGTGSIRATGTSAFANSVELITDSQGTVSLDCKAASDAGTPTVLLSEAGFAPSLDTRFYAKGWLGIWKFDENQGSVARDRSPFARDATLNDVVWTTGTVNSAISLDATEPSLAIVEDSSATLELGKGDFTAMVWIRTTQTGTARILGQGYYDNEPGFAIDLGIGGPGRVSAVLGLPGQQSVRLTTTGTFNDGNWHHVGIVFNRATGSAGILVDGVRRSVQAGEPPAGSSLTAVPVGAEIESGAGQVLVFGWARGSASYFDGDLDEARLFRGALSDTEIASYASTPADSDDDQLPDSWEQQIVDADPNDAIDDISDVLPGGDFDGDGISNKDEFLAGSDPVDFYNGSEPVIIVLGGNNQNGNSGVLLQSPILLRVMDVKGDPLQTPPLRIVPEDPQAAVGTSPTTLSNDALFLHQPDLEFFLRP